jgi:hypothetical protein
VYLAGFTTYGKTGLTYYAQQQLVQADAAGTFGAVTTVYTAASQAGPWTAGTQLNLEASNHAALLADVAHVYGLTGAPTLEIHGGDTLLSAGATLSATAAGQPQVLNGADGITYDYGRHATFGNSGQLINSTSPAAITGTSVTLTSGVDYHIQGWVTYTGGQNAGQAQFNFGGTSTVSHADGRAFFLKPGVGLSNVSIFNGSLALAGSPTMDTGLWRWEFDLWLTISGTGTFDVTAQEGTNGDTFTINSAYVRAETYNG